MSYHIGFVKGYGRRAGTVIVEMRRNKDYLNAELWKYLGQFEATKKEMRERKRELLAEINQTYTRAFTRIIID